MVALQKLQSVYKSNFPCEVDYDTSLVDQLVQSGIICLNPGDLRVFKSNAVGKGIKAISVGLLATNARLTIKEAMAEVLYYGRPATIEEVLALRHAYSYLEVSIVALGSICKDPPLIPATFMYQGKCRLGFFNPTLKLEAHHNFAYVAEN